MIALIDSLNHIGDTWFGVVSSVIVQSVVVVALATGTAKLLRKHSVSLRFWVWQAAALKLMIVPFSIIVVLPLWPATQIQEVDRTALYLDPSPPVDNNGLTLSYADQVATSSPVIRTAPNLTVLAYA